VSSYDQLTQSQTIALNPCRWLRHVDETPPRRRLVLLVDHDLCLESMFVLAAVNDGCEIRLRVSLPRIWWHAQSDLLANTKLG